jgi:hypothetical protein
LTHEARNFDIRLELENHHVHIEGSASPLACSHRQYID